MGSKPNWARGAGALGEALFRYGMSKERQKFLEEERRQREQAMLGRMAEQQAHIDRRFQQTFDEQGRRWDLSHESDEAWRDYLRGKYEEDQALRGRQLTLSEMLGESLIRDRREDNARLQAKADTDALDDLRPTPGEINTAINTDLPPNKVYKDGEVVETPGRLMSPEERRNLLDSKAVRANFQNLFATAARESLGSDNWVGRPASEATEAAFRDVLDREIDLKEAGLGGWEFKDGEFYRQRARWPDEHKSIKDFVKDRIHKKMGKSLYVTEAVLKKYGLTLEDYLRAEKAGAVQAATQEVEAEDAIDKALNQALGIKTGGQ